MNRSRTVCLLVFGILWIGFSSLEAQIVNIEKKRIATDTTGWFGTANVSFAGSKTTKSVVSFFAGTFLEYKSKSNKDLWLLISDFSLISGDEEKFSNAGFGHLRYNRKLGKSIRWEIFTQLQYNSLTKIGTRALVGTGPRFKLTDFEEAKFYFGVAYMYEYEELIDPFEILYQHRMSSYFSFTLSPEETVTFASTTYFQPLLNDYSDYKLTNETTLFLGITQKLSLNVTLKYNYDSVPPEEVPNTTFYFITGLELAF